jgi:D-serine deaminase-like pyridoxal phosphate-dependent protein
VKIPDLDTPCLVVDRGTMMANLRRMQTYCDANRLALRPHIKTHKTREIAALQGELGARGLTFQKLGEVEALDPSGAVDVLVSYNIVGRPKLQRLAALAHKRTMSVTTDDLGVAKALSAAMVTGGTRVGVWVDCDTGLGRTGVQSRAEAIELGCGIDRLPGLELRGLFTYPTPTAGGWFGQAIADWRDAGLPGPEVSVGGTPGAFSTHELGTATELRVGTYVFNDVECLEAGAAELGDCALTILATCVSRPTRDRAIVDAGSKSIGLEVADIGAGPVFGLVRDRPTVALRSVYEEHGILASSDPDSLPEIGDSVAIVPAHCCVAVNLHDSLHVAEGGEVVDRWTIVARGRVR